MYKFLLVIQLMLPMIKREHAQVLQDNKFLFYLIFFTILSHHLFSSSRSPVRNWLYYYTSVIYHRSHLRLLNHLMNNKATNVLHIGVQQPRSAAGFVLSISIYSVMSVFVYATRGAGCFVFFIQDMNTMCGSILSSGPSTCNLLLCSHFPTTTEAYKLP